VWQLSAPLVALETVRTNAQEARNKLEIAQLQEAWGPSLVWVELPYGKEEKVSLSWHLSRREQCTIERVWRDKYGAGGTEVDKIAAILRPPTQAAAPLPLECLP
jgi:hypothetical protein